MKILASSLIDTLVLVVLVHFVSACAGGRTTWECVGTSCEAAEQSMAKCQAKANAYFIASNDQGFMEQCMRAEGFRQVPD
jgi:hypothetical protein